jgi:soluble lytic murein transglycosylase-like protein
MSGRSPRLHLHLPLLLGALATVGAVGQLDAAPRDGSQALEQALEQARTMRLVQDAHSLVPEAAVAIASELAPSNIGPLSMIVVTARDDMTPNPSVPAPPSAQPPAQSSAADRLRDDAVQTAPVPLRAVRPAAPVKLSGNERAIARHIARTYRIAHDSVERFVHYAYKAASEFRLDPHLILAVMATESSFDPNAESSAGAQGLMQVLTRVHTSKFEPYGGVEAAWDPVANIRVGARILSEYVNRHGDVAAGLKAYVGAALLGSDGGYGSKVMKRQAEFDAVLRPQAPAPMQAERQAAPVAQAGKTEAAALVDGVDGPAAPGPGF